MRTSLLPILYAFAATPVLAETAIAPEINPPGDIPDSQVFVNFVSPNAFTLKVPEGWARKDDGAITTFSDKYNRIAILYTSPSPPVDEPTAKSTVLPDLQKNGRAVEDLSIKSIKVAGDLVVLITYTANSEPSAVTNKRVREEDERIIYWRAGKRVDLTLSAPKGADNADQWDLIAKSFRWK